ncbi:MAG: hypothetical protein ACR2P8_10195 [Myxococcota bacterium]
MATRMHCGDCGNTDFADTWLEGSDALEGLGWALGGVGGWLYCAWRFALRRKRCAHCGGEALQRESRASRERAAWPAPPHFDSRVLSAKGGAIWPASLRDPRRRLRHGLPHLGAWALLALGYGQAGLGLAFAWVVLETLRSAEVRLRVCEERVTPRPLGAWNDAGRSLHIDWV